MRIISGIAKGRSIQAPKGLATRPTLDRIKESLFGMLQFELSDARVLDLFAGSGNLGLEAISRGAAHAVFNDHSRQACMVIKRNLESLGFQNKSTILQLEYRHALIQLSEQGQVFDLVFLDPPYLDGAEDALENLVALELIVHGGKVIVEYALDKPPKVIPSGLRCSKQKKYGDVGICILEREQLE